MGLPTVARPLRPVKTLLAWVNNKTEPSVTANTFTDSFVDLAASLSRLVPDGPAGHIEAEALICTDEKLTDNQRSIETLRRVIEERFEIEGFIKPDEYVNAPNKEATGAYLSLFQALEK